MKINWEDFDIKMKEIKHPHILIHKFFNNIHLINDTESSIILRYIIKNYMKIFLEKPFYLLINKLENSHSKTTEVLIDFYKNIKNRNKIINHLKKWYLAFKNRLFWGKKIEEQIIFLNNIKLRIQAAFDTSKGGVSFIIKMIPILKGKYDSSETINSAIERLKIVYKLMGINFFTEYNIPIISSEQFYKLDNMNIIKYMNIVYSKTLEHINIVINLFEQLNMINLKLYDLLNPCFVNIEEDNLNIENEDITELFI
jgi:hypothetical protein